MDKFDQKIIGELRSNARMSISSISQTVNLSRSAVSERIKKLENSGIIKGYQVLLSESQKQTVSAYFEIHHKCASCRDVVPLFKALPEVITCRSISGDMDLLVYLTASSMQRIHQIREYLDTQEQITKVKTHMVMSEWMASH